MIHDVIQIMATLWNFIAKRRLEDIIQKLKNKNIL